MKKLIATAALLAATSVPAFAADYVIDKDHTMVFFSVSHLGFSNSTGQFTDFDGKFSFDEANPEKSKVEVTIQTDSIDLANNAKWNKHMKSDDFFKAEKYPTATFISKSVQETGDKTLSVSGDLTLLGKTKPVTLDVTFNKVGEAFGKQIAGFSATATIDRTEFGITNYAPAVSAEVLLRFEVEGNKR